MLPKATKLQNSKRLPDSTDVDAEALTNTIREGLTALGLQIETLDLGARISHEFYGQRSLNLSATGPSSAQFAAIEALLKAPQERQLQTLTLTHAKTEAPSVLRLQIQMHLYDNAAP